MQRHQRGSGAAVTHVSVDDAEGLERPEGLDDQPPAPALPGHEHREEAPRQRQAAREGQVDRAPDPAQQ